MKYNEFKAFIVGFALIIIGAIFYAYSESTPNGKLGVKLEIVAYCTFLPGVALLISMFIFGRKTNNNA
jgi:hypothetical protein